MAMMRHERRARAAPAPTADAVVEVRQWSSEQFTAHIDEAMAIYAQAMGYPTSAAGQRGITARRHSGNAGFACRAALSPDSTLIGFGYGYTTTPGQWWHDLVRKAMTAQVAADWLGNAFELSELHVLPRFQGRGIGRRVLIELAGAIPHAAMLLSTPDADTRAFRLYRDLGFLELRRRYLFPGDARPFAVLGARLPLEPPHRP